MEVHGTRFSEDDLMPSVRDKEEEERKKKKK